MFVHTRAVNDVFNFDDTGKNVLSPKCYIQTATLILSMKIKTPAPLVGLKKYIFHYTQYGSAIEMCAWKNVIFNILFT